MKRSFSATFVLLAALTVPIPLSAKGSTVKITVAGGALTAPIESTEIAVGRFHIWAGPGVVANGVPERDGFIAQWSKGTAHKRKGELQRYDVSFYKGCDMSEFGCRTSTPSLAYVIAYEYDPSIDQGYVYLPGRGEKWYQLNTSSILRGLEGQWFLATDEWRKFFQTLMERGTTRTSTAR